MISTQALQEHLSNIEKTTGESWAQQLIQRKKEEAEFHRIVAWNKLAELCSQLLSKGRKVYVEGRLQTRSWETPDGQNKQTTEVVIDDMRILDSRREAYGEEYVPPVPAASSVNQPVEEKVVEEPKVSSPADDKKPVKEPKAREEKVEPITDQDVDLDELPF